MGEYASLAPRHVPPAQVKRREALHTWLQQEEEGVTAAEAVEWSNVYTDPSQGEGTCAEDLRALEEVGMVTRRDGRREYWFTTFRNPIDGPQDSRPL